MAPELIARSFNLTPTELRVLLGIVEVGGVAETAKALGIARGTVKTHLQRLFAKTGTNRQAELVKARRRVLESPDWLIRFFAAVGTRM